MFFLMCPKGSTCLVNISTDPVDPLAENMVSESLKLILHSFFGWWRNPLWPPSPPTVTNVKLLRCWSTKIVPMDFYHNSKKNRARIKNMTSFEIFRKLCIWWTLKFYILAILELRKLSLKLISRSNFKNLEKWQI